MTVIVVYPWNKIVADITSLMSAMTSLLGRVVGVENVNTTQNTRLTNIEALNVVQTNRLNTNDTLNTTQNGRLDNAESVNSVQNGRLSYLEHSFVTLIFEPNESSSVLVMEFEPPKERLVIGAKMMKKWNPDNNPDLDSWLFEFDNGTDDRVECRVNRQEKTVTLYNTTTAPEKMYVRYMVVLQFA
jgi:hypothetical protein